MSLTFDEARHFLSRTGFGGTPDEIRRIMPLDRGAAVEQVVGTRAHEVEVAPPLWATRLPPLPKERKHWSDRERKTFREARKEEGLELKCWWYRVLMSTRNPLLERMTLFWHNHFTSSLQKVRWPPFLYQQNMLFRIHALGSFRTLLSAVAKNPAMLLYLDTQTSHRDHPNENFARELFELFTLGEGHYTETDIKHAARAFTGWHVDSRTGAFHKEPRRHDDGWKTVFGKSGPLDGEDILAATLEQPEVSRHLVRKLWREFISDEPDHPEVDRLAASFRQTYNIASLLNGLFLTAQFWAAENRGCQIKSPVELMVGTGRMFDLRIEEPMQFVRYGRRLGQDLFDPPNVKGWPGGRRWITTTTLLDRTQMLHRAIRGHEMGHVPTNDRSGMTHARNASWLATEPLDIVLATLLPLTAVQPVNEAENRAQIVRQLVLDPVYQLK